jgi:hypothetical protein
MGDVVVAGRAGDSLASQVRAVRDSYLQLVILVVVLFVCHDTGVAVHALDANVGGVGRELCGENRMSFLVAVRADYIARV